MSTPAPSAEQAPVEEQPFDPHAFPEKLCADQRRAAELYAEIHAMQKRLPWSREPDLGWPAVEERGRERAGRESSPGWDPADAAAYDKLHQDLLAAAAAVNVHAWWTTCERRGVKGAALVAARQALKHADGAVPLSREDVEETA
ncbi:hypothetical protein AB0H92_10805 [Streptomyces phaeochromogenes]|uniref:hypothetical protein n=1 Tax=Streptomyces phaeochromogenes TaxID=1923 RepID=UPI0033E4793F